MRLIDADALIAEMKEYRTEQEKEQMYSGDRGICVTWNDAVFFIKNAPTIEPEPSQVARDIAAIIENEMDMRVIARSAKPQWIPCSERLPDELEEVNVTWVNHSPEPYYNFVKDKPFTATAVYYKEKWYWYSSVCADILAESGTNYTDEIDSAIEITAWMPLPESYLGETELRDYENKGDDD